LIEYTKKAVVFAKALDCPNIVFGCPRNRNIPQELKKDTALKIAKYFFSKIADFAFEHGTTIALEANPAIYNTNFINTTADAFKLCRNINNPGLKVNVDLGTIIHNEESINIILENIDLVNHIHISEPNLATIEKRNIHKELTKMLYNKYFSIEMKNTENIDQVKDIIFYVNGLFL
jgi:sugar phosphate isomerase/epimerase